MSYGIVVGRDGGCLDQLFPGLTSQSLPSFVNSSPEVSPVSYACRGSGGTLRPFLSDGGAERTRLEVRKIGVKFGGGPVSAVAPLYQQSCLVYSHLRQPLVLPRFWTHLLQTPPEALHLERWRKS